MEKVRGEGCIKENFNFKVIHFLVVILCFVLFVPLWFVLFMAMFTLCRIVKQSVAESVQDRASVHTKNAALIRSSFCSGTVLLRSTVESGKLRIG